MYFGTSLITLEKMMKTITITKMLVLAMLFITPFFTAEAVSPKGQENATFNTTSEAVSGDADYWTEERLKNAKPLPLPQITDEQFKTLTQELEKGERKKENVQIQEEGPKDNNQEKAATLGVPESANVNERPFWNGGKLYFTKPDGDYICTAEFTGQNNILLTAAHCVRDGNTGQFYKNFRFYRAYNGGGGQYVGWTCAMAYYMWYTPPMNFKYDYAFIHTDRTSGAGWLGWKTQIPYNTWTAIGYPQNSGNNQYMYKVVGDKGPIYNGIVQMNNNPFNGGASGGAWIGDLTTPYVGGNYAIGLNSFIRQSDPNKMWGPLFDNEWVNLYNKTVNNCQE